MSKVEIIMKQNKRFFISSLSIIMALCFMFTDNANAAPRTAVRGTATTARKSVTSAKQAAVAETVEETTAKEEEPTPTATDAPIILNKSNQFETAVTAVLESAAPDNSFAEQIRKQREARNAAAARDTAASSQQNALKSGSNVCDKDLRECMKEKCGEDFVKCALDGDTIFGDKLNSCKRNTTCSGEEFTLFSREIKADRDLNVRLLSYENVVECGNQYNACLVNECGKTFDKCLGKTAADSAIQKCSVIATECKEADSGLASRFGTAIGKLRGSAEANVKKDEERLYKLRDLMSKQCKSLGAAFDERSFDCVYTVNFFAGNDQNKPTASRKAYAGSSFTCMQEWFGINATTFKENAYRETRSQTAASSAMLGAGLGTAAGLVTSGAIDRAITTQKAKKDFKSECEAQGFNFKKGKCLDENGFEVDVSSNDNDVNNGGGGDNGGNNGGNNGSNNTPQPADNNGTPVPANAGSSGGNTSAILADFEFNEGPEEFVTEEEVEETEEMKQFAEDQKNKKHHIPCTDEDFKASTYTKNATEGWYYNKKCVAKSCSNGYELAKDSKGNSQGYCKKKK